MTWGTDFSCIEEQSFFQALEGSPNYRPKPRLRLTYFWTVVDPNISRREVPTAETFTRLHGMLDVANRVCSGAFFYDPSHVKWMFEKAEDAEAFRREAADLIEPQAAALRM